MSVISFSDWSINHPTQQQTRAALTTHRFYVTNKLGRVSERLKTGAVRKTFLSPNPFHRAAGLKPTDVGNQAFQFKCKEKKPKCEIRSYHKKRKEHIYICLSFSFLLLIVFVLKLSHVCDILISFLLFPVHPDSHHRFPSPPVLVWSILWPSPWQPPHPHLR